MGACPPFFLVRVICARTMPLTLMRQPAEDRGCFGAIPSKEMSESQNRRSYGTCVIAWHANPCRPYSSCVRLPNGFRASCSITCSAVSHHALTWDAAASPLCSQASRKRQTTARKSCKPPGGRTIGLRWFISRPLGCFASHRFPGRVDVHEGVVNHFLGSYLVPVDLGLGDGARERLEAQDEPGRLDAEVGRLGGREGRVHVREPLLGSGGQVGVHDRVEGIFRRDDAVYRATDDEAALITQRGHAERHDDDGRRGRVRDRLRRLLPGVHRRHPERRAERERGQEGRERQGGGEHRHP